MQRKFIPAFFGIVAFAGFGWLYQTTVHVPPSGQPGFSVVVESPDGDSGSAPGAQSVSDSLLAWGSNLSSTQAIQVLNNSAYAVLYSNTMKNPLAVRYSLSWQNASDAPMKRPKVPFQEDERTSARVNANDYTRTGYDRGHMAPSFAIGKFFGRDAQIETFLMSNISPQTHLMNDGVWNSIERMEADDFAKRFGVVDVVCGPVFEPGAPAFPSGVFIPSGHFKVIRRPDGQAIAFFVPQNPTMSQPEACLTSIAAIEQATGLIIFPGDVTNDEKERRRTKIW